MKKIITILIVAAFAWSIQACANRNINNGTDDTRRVDTTNTQPMDTTNMRQE